jgi:ERCC4-related helicase
MDESELEDKEDPEIAVQKQEIQDEINAVQAIIDVASRISSNAKITALKTALRTAFAQQEEEGIPLKAVVFTESKRTQKYIAAELRKDGYSEEDILSSSMEISMTPCPKRSSVPGR